MSGKKITVAAIQMDAKPAPIPARLSQADILVNSAAQAGAELVLLPELFNTGYSYASDHHQLAREINGPTANWMKESARRNQIYLAGSIMLLDGVEVFNSLLLFAPDGRNWRYDKNYPWGWERGTFREGYNICIAHTDLGDIGMLICWDVAHRDLWKRYAGQVDLMLVCSCPPDVSNPTFHLPDGNQLTFDNMGAIAANLKNEGRNVFDQALSQQITWLGVPALVSTGCGSIRTTLPNGRLSLFFLSLTAPQLLKHLSKANQVEMFAEIIPAGKILDSGGITLSNLNPLDGQSFCLAQIQLSREKKQHFETQPKTGISWLTYLISDFFLPSMSIPVYRKGLRKTWGNRMAPIQSSTWIWTTLLTIIGMIALIIGSILGKRIGKK